MDATTGIVLDFIEFDGGASRSNLRVRCSALARTTWAVLIHIGTALLTNRCLGQAARSRVGFAIRFVIGDKLAPEAGEGACLEMGADLRHEVEVKVQVVQ